MKINENSGKKGIPLYYSIPLLFIFITILLLFVFIFNISTPVSLQPAILNYVNVSSCGILNQDNTYYTLNRSLVTNGTCIYLYAHNSILDGNYKHSIVSTNSTNISFAVENRGNGNIIQRLNVSSFYIGLYSYATQRTKIIGNVINDSLTGIRVVNSVNVSVIRNKIINFTWAGIDFWGSSGLGINSAEGVQGNFLQRIDYIANHPGIYLNGSSNFNISSNYIGYSMRGLELHYSDNNAFSNNTLHTGEFGIFSKDSKHNTFINETIENFITPINSVDSIFNLSKIKIIPASSSIGPIDIVDSGSNIVLKDTYIQVYNLFNTRIKFINSGKGEISFYPFITATGNNLSSDVKIGTNFVEVNSVNSPGFNQEALVKLINISTTFNTPIILRNGAPCPSSICVNLTALNTGNVLFNVTGWTNYSIGNGSDVSSMNSFIAIEEPTINKIIYTNNFPSTFIVNLNQSGKVWFTLNNGITNVTMLNSSNTSTQFTYNQNTLAVGNYTFIVYANFTGTTQKATQSVNFSVRDPILPPMVPFMIVNTPDEEDIIYTNNFPITFIVSLSQFGKVWFTLNNGTTNITMSNSSNANTYFTYNQNTLAVGNYTMKAYANFSNTNFIANSSVKFRVISSSSGISMINILEPDTNENYYLGNFPLVFLVSLNQSGKVWFTLNNGTTNITMSNSSNANTYFTYNQNTLAVGNYTMKAYANFSNTNFIANSSVKFGVWTNLSGGLGGSGGFPTNQTNVSNIPSPIPINIPPNNPVNDNPPELEKESSAMGSVVFWLILIILIVAIGVLIFFIIQSIKFKKINQNAVLKNNSNNNYKNIMNGLR